MKKKKKKHNIFIDTINVIIIWLKSSIGSDVLTIPKGLGNSLLVTNSCIVTNDRVTTIIRVNLLGRKVPFNLISVISSELRRKNIRCVIDPHIKLSKMTFNSKALEIIDTNNFGWGKLVENNKQGKSKKDAQWGIDSTNDLLTNTAYSAALYIKIFARDGITLNKAIEIIDRVLMATESYFFKATYSLTKLMQEISITSLDTNSGQSFPVIGSEITKIAPLPVIRSDRGIVFGLNDRSKEPYTIDLASETEARNILVVATSGSGKTFLVINLAQYCLEHNYRCLAVDIKGNEFTTLTKSVGGIVLDMTDNSRNYVDFLRRFPSKDQNNSKYFRDMDNLFLETLKTLAGENLTSLETSFLSGFITWLWDSMGVVCDNTFSWTSTQVLTIHDMFDKLQDYSRQFISSRKKGEDTIKINNMMRNLQQYLSRDSLYRRIWETPINVNNILNTRFITFSFNVRTDSNYDLNVFRVRWNFMNYINQKFTANNYNNRIRTLKILEEVQSVSADVMKMYSDEWRLGRSFMQETVILTNSARSVFNNSPDARSIQSNTRILLLSRCEDDELNFLLEKYDIKDQVTAIKNLNKAENANKFLIYPLSGSVPPAIIKAIMKDTRKTMLPKVLKPSNI